MPMTLSNAQLSTIRKEMDIYYVLPKLVGLVRKKYNHSPEIAELSDTELTAKVRRCLHDAWDLELFSQSDILAFVAYELLYFPCFGQHPLVRRALRTPVISKDARMLSLCLQLSASQWYQIKQECDLMAAEADNNQAVA